MALVSYRNNMFHNGFEWPPETREKFSARIKNDGWPGNWFTQATRGDVPWVFYMSDDFVAKCLELIEKVLDGVGKLLERGETEQI
ncbi:MAG: hypothetical protein NT133_14565 [Alphaproteobacteria bacterium]|nr:hypothetical protein [Alphaproteobacteria bacterium]